MRPTRRLQDGGRLAAPLFLCMPERRGRPEPRWGRADAVPDRLPEKPNLAESQASPYPRRNPQAPPRRRLPCGCAASGQRALPAQGAFSPLRNGRYAGTASPWKAVAGEPEFRGAPGPSDRPLPPALRPWRLQPYRQSLPLQAEPSLLTPADPAEFAQGGACPPQASGTARLGKARASPDAKRGCPNRQASTLRNRLSVQHALPGNRAQLAQPARRVESAKRSPALTQPQSRAMAPWRPLPILRAIERASWRHVCSGRPPGAFSSPCAMPSAVSGTRREASARPGLSLPISTDRFA